MTRPALARAAAILCGNPDFQRFLAYRYPAPWGQSGDLPAHKRAASVIYTVCRIQSRRELDTNAEARRRYDRLVGLPYSSWRAAKSGGSPICGASVRVAERPF
ncbi:hypothetical protein MNJPNG_06220 [Cupriavidus oxalaticus]|uniref:hypothetical protein n=1 Tax=Cupriavidus oxalaticus TaxID=96344 RepID=UPI003F741FFC